MAHQRKLSRPQVDTNRVGMLLGKFRRLKFYSFPDSGSFYFLAEMGYRDGKIISHLCAPHTAPQKYIESAQTLKGFV